MSEPEGFVSRWARLKREAAQAPSLDAAAEQTRAPQAAAPTPEGAEPSVDLSALPPLESITAATDIRAYLMPGVPAELTRAALRRAWVADPTIRDFVGIAENQWDFNDPHGVPGFGPLDEAGRAVARMLFGLEPTPAPMNAAPPAEAPVASVQDEKSLESGQPLTDATPGDVASAGDELPATAVPVRPSTRASDSMVALQQQEESVPPARAFRRGHGGALPE